MALAARAQPSVEHHPRSSITTHVSGQDTKLQGAMLDCSTGLCPAFFQAGNQVVAHREETMEERDKWGKERGRGLKGK